MAEMSATATFAPNLAGARPRISPGLIRLTLLYLWITIASIGIVFIEPAPFDALILGAMLLLPLAGLVRFSGGVALYFTLWMVVVAAGFVAATQAFDVAYPSSHTAITLHLALATTIVASFVANRPAYNVRLIMSAYAVSAVVASIAGIAGYFDMFPGAFDLFTEYGRARGTFKDPNVLGAFLVPAVLYGFNIVLTRRLAPSLPWIAVLPMLMFGLLLTFSRGAWINLAVSLAVYAFLTFGTAGTNWQRLKLIVCVVLAGALAAGIFLGAQSIPEISDLMEQRASFDQSYDVGPQGRFAGHEKALGLAAEHPLGIGAGVFHERYHHEDVHEVYLSMFLNSGWVGGTVYLGLVLLTVWLGLATSLKDRGGDGLSAVLFACFVGVALEGSIIDTDHWRHFFLLMGMVWGMALAQHAEALRSERGSAPRPV